MVERKTRAATAKKPADDKIAAPEKIMEAIRQRAYEKHIARGCVPGYELDDWLAAESEIKAKFRVAG